MYRGKYWRENGVDGDYEVTRPGQARCSLLDGRLTTERWEAAAAARRCDDVTVARCRDEMTAQTAQLHGPAGLDTGLIYISHPQHQPPQPTPPTAITISAICCLSSRLSLSNTQNFDSHTSILLLYLIVFYIKSIVLYCISICNSTNNTRNQLIANIILSPQLMNPWFLVDVPAAGIKLKFMIPFHSMTAWLHGYVSYNP